MFDASHGLCIMSGFIACNLAPKLLQRYWSFFPWAEKWEYSSLSLKKNYSCNKQSIVNKAENGIGLALKASPFVNVSVEFDLIMWVEFVCSFLLC